MSVNMHLEEIRNKMTNMLDDLDNGYLDMSRPADVKRAFAMTNAVGKIINADKVMLEYTKQRREKPFFPHMMSTVKEI